MVPGIRACVEGDFEAVAGLLQQLWPEMAFDREALREVFAECLKDDSYVFLCALEAEEVIGFCSMHIRRSLWQQGLLAYVDELVVDERFRGKGMGARLLAWQIALAWARGCRFIELDSALKRESAHRFYELMGFERFGYTFGMTFQESEGEGEST